MSKLCPMCNEVTNCTDNCKSCFEETRIDAVAKELMAHKSLLEIPHEYMYQLAKAIVDLGYVKKEELQ